MRVNLCASSESAPLPDTSTSRRGLRPSIPARLVTEPTPVLAEQGNWPPLRSNQSMLSELGAFPNRTGVAFTVTVCPAHHEAVLPRQLPCCTRHVRGLGFEPSPCAFCLRMFPFRRPVVGL